MVQSLFVAEVSDKYFIVGQLWPLHAFFEVAAFVVAVFARQRAVLLTAGTLCAAWLGLAVVDLVIDDPLRRGFVRELGLPYLVRQTLCAGLPLLAMAVGRLCRGWWIEGPDEQRRGFPPSMPERGEDGARNPVS